MVHIPEMCSWNDLYARPFQFGPQGVHAAIIGPAECAGNWSEWFPCNDRLRHKDVHAANSGIMLRGIMEAFINAAMFSLITIVFILRYKETYKSEIV